MRVRPLLSVEGGSESVGGSLRRRSGGYKDVQPVNIGH